MHEPLDSVDAVVMPEYPIDGRPAVALPPGELGIVLLHARDKRLEELTDAHVLRDVRGRLAELVLQEGVCFRFLDKVDNGVRMAEF